MPGPRTLLLFVPMLFAAAMFPADAAPYDQRAAAALARGDVEEAAAAWEELASDAPRAPRAPEALAEAALLRLALDQLARVDADARLLQRSFGDARPDLAAQVIVARVRHDEDAEQWEDARVRLSGALAWLDRRAPAEARAEAHAIHARLLARLDHEREAHEERKRVIALAVLPGERADRWSTGARDAVAEARFALAEEKREAAEQVVLAPYRGKGDRESVLAYHRDKAEPWLRRRRYLVEVAENAYQQVLGIFEPPPEPPRPPPPPPPPGSIGLLGGDPNAPTAPWGRETPGLDPKVGPPSPRWAIAAAARVGALWSDLRHEVNSLPLPRESIPVEWREVYFMTRLDSPSDDLRMRAKGAFVLCLQLAERHRIWTEDAQRCEAWLARNDGAEYHTTEELHREELYPSPIAPGEPARR